MFSNILERTEHPGEFDQAQVQIRSKSFAELPEKLYQINSDQPLAVNSLAMASLHLSEHMQ